MTPAADTKRFTSFAEFYPYYLEEHRNPICRRLHFVGTTLGSLCLLIAILTWSGGWLLTGLVIGYAFAWVGHFFFEKNRPATFKYPIYSFMGDYVMYKDIWTGKVKLS